MKKYFLIVMAGIITLCIYLLLRRPDDIPIQLEDSIEAYQNLIKENSAGMDKSIQIYAKVVDGDTNKPLQGVVIEVDYTHL